MANFTIKQLTAGLTLEDAESELLEFLQDEGILTTDWKEGSPELTLLKLMAYVYTELVNRCAQNAYNSLNAYAVDSALTYLADSHFDNQRELSEVTVGNMVVTGSASIVPKTFAATELKVTDGDYVFYNVNQFTLSHAIPYVTESFRAESAGAEYNIVANSTLSTVASNIGVTVTNPALTGSTTWITTLGRDTESDSTLRTRNTAKWTSLQTSEVTLDRLKSIALNASPELTYVSIDDNAPRGPGSVDVYCSRDTVPTVQSDIDLVQAALNLAFFNNSTGERVTAYGATAKYFDKTIKVYYYPSANSTTVYAAVQEAIDDWIATIPIGGKAYTTTLTNIASVYDLIRLLEDLDGVAKVSFDSPTDISFAVDEKLLTPASGYDSLITMIETLYDE
jgi:phage-related baseplate assembly protein